MPDQVFLPQWFGTYQPVMRRKAEVFNTDAHPEDTATDVVARLEAEKDAWQRRMQTLHDEQERFQIENPDRPVQTARRHRTGRRTS
jgi:hypothetical protein